MKCSTQPIYLEFRNMTDLKSEVLKCVESYLNEHVFSFEGSEQSIVKVYLNYLHFSESEKVLFRTLYIEKHEGVEMIKKFSQERFMDSISRDINTSKLCQIQKEELCEELWIVATGIGCLRSGGMVSMTDETIIEKLLSIIETYNDK